MNFLDKTTKQLLRRFKDRLDEFYDKRYVALDSHAITTNTLTIRGYRSNGDVIDIPIYIRSDGNLSLGNFNDIIATMQEDISTAQGDIKTIRDVDIKDINDTIKDISDGGLECTEKEITDLFESQGDTK